MAKVMHGWDYRLDRDVIKACSAQALAASRARANANPPGAPRRGASTDVAIEIILLITIVAFRWQTEPLASSFFAESILLSVSLGLLLPLRPSCFATS